MYALNPKGIHMYTHIHPTLPHLLFRSNVSLQVRNLAISAHNCRSLLLGKVFQRHNLGLQFLLHLCRNFSLLLKSYLFLKAHKQQSAPPSASSIRSSPWLQHLSSSNPIRIKTNNKNHFQRHIFSPTIYASNSVFAVAATSLLLKSYSYEYKQQKAPQSIRRLRR